MLGTCFNLRGLCISFTIELRLSCEKCESLELNSIFPGLIALIVKMILVIVVLIVPTSSDYI